MRWNKKTEPKIGDRKTITRFAFFPVKINYKERVWWERYTKTYEYQNCQREEPVSFIFDVYKTVYYNDWVLINKNYKN